MLHFFEFIICAAFDFAKKYRVIVKTISVFVMFQVCCELQKSRVCGVICVCCECSLSEHRFLRTGAMSEVRRQKDLKSASKPGLNDSN